MELNLVNILFLSSSYPSTHDLINKTFMSDFAESLSLKKFHVFVLCPHRSGLLYEEVQKEITIIRFPYWFTSSGQRLTEKEGIIASIQKSPCAIIQMIPFCVCQFLVALKIIRREKINLVHSHWIIPQGLIGAMIQFFIRIPHITTIHGTDIYLIHAHRFTYPLMRVIGHYSNIITTNSKHTYKLLLDIISYKREKIRIIPMGINVNEFSRMNIKTTKPHKTILFIGRLIDLKGVHILIKAMKVEISRNNNVQLIIIGDGPKRKNLEQCAKNLGISSSINFLGNQGRDNLLLYYQIADVFVLPSIKYKNQAEGLGVVLLEAMASGTPVIGSNTGGIPDIIEDGVNGLLVIPGDPESLAKAIRLILENPYLTEKFRKSGLKKVREFFSWDVIIEHFIEIYQKVLLK